MEAFVGPLAVACGLLAIAGGYKLARPEPTVGALRAAGLPSTLASRTAVRALGIGELALGVATPLTGSAALAALVGAVYLGFAGFVVLALGRGTLIQSCGCFGAREVPPSPVHVALDVAAAAVAIGAAASASPSLPDVLRDQPAGGWPLLAVAAVATWLALVALTDLPTTLHAAARR
jgi:hypothetical protein